jgi:hypothetical protein
MSLEIRRLLRTSAAVLAARAIIAQGPAPPASPLVVRDGLATFEVATNVFGTKVHGRSTALAAGAVIRDGETELLLERLEASLPPASLKTGIKLRDQHMIKYIFRTADGQVPDVRFSADGARCTRTDAAAAYKCPALGTLSIRNDARPFSIALEAMPDGDAYRVRGVSTVVLSAYGIDRPSQFGVSTEDTVKVHVEFVARRSPASRTSAGAPFPARSGAAPPPQ